MFRIYQITYDQYYPNAPTEIIIDLNKHNESNIREVIKNITGHFPKEYKIEKLLF